MSAYTVLATRLYRLREDGSEQRFNAGDVVRDLSEDDVKRHLAAGNIGPVRASDEPVAFDDSGADPGDADLGDDGDSDGTGDDSTGPEKPAADANKPVLVAWIFDNVAKPDGSDYTKSELNKMKPEELRDLIDSVEP